MTTYKPREGSVAQRAIAHLTEHGPMYSAPLAEAIDVSPHSLSACLEHPVAMGALRRERREHLFWWSIGDGKPLPRATKEPPLADGVDIDKVGKRYVDLGPVNTNASAAGASPAADGSQTPGGTAASPRAKAGSDTSTQRLQHVLKAEPATADATDRSPKRPASPGVGPMGAGQAADAAPAADELLDPPFRCGLWSDGSFAMFLPDGTDVHLTPSQTMVLVRYLDRLAPEAA